MKEIRREGQVKLVWCGTGAPEAGSEVMGVWARKYKIDFVAFEHPADYSAALPVIVRADAVLFNAQPEEIERCIRAMQQLGGKLPLLAVPAAICGYLAPDLLKDVKISPYFSLAGSQVSQDLPGFLLNQLGDGRRR